MQLYVFLKTVQTIIIIMHALIVLNSIEKINSYVTAPAHMRSRGEKFFCKQFPALGLSTGPNMEPWGTPEDTSAGGDV